MSPKVTNTFIFLILAALSLVIFANSMTKPLGRDEQVYCTAGILLAQGKMVYRDFSYPSQMPYHPLIYAALFRIFNTTHFLLVARIFSSLCDILVVVCIVGIYWRIFSSFPISAMLLSTSAAVLYVFNPFVDYANGYAWNNDAVILCIVLSFWLFITIDFKKKSKYWRIAVIAALLTLATCMRITVILVQLLFFIVLLFQPAGSIKQKFKIVLLFLITTAVVAIWPVWTIALAPRAFFLNLYRISILNGEWVHRTGLFHSKPYMIFLFLTTRGCFALILIAVYPCIIITLKRHKLVMPNASGMLLAVLLTIIFFTIALIMPTTWRQHFAMPVPFIIISFAFPLLYLRKLNSDTSPNKHFKLARALVVACTVAAAVSYPIVLRRVPKLFDLQSWTPIQLHRISQDIAEKTKSPKLILTLAPLYALEGGCDIYTEFSSGPFVYRVADYLSPSDRRLTHTVGRRSLKELIEKSPPSALIRRVDSEFLEVHLFQAAEPNQESWDIKIYENGPIVYFRR